MEIIFYIHATAAVMMMALAMLSTHAVHALLYMVLSLLGLAVSMYSLSAHLAAALEVIVYAGAIMVLFVFAIMLLNISVISKPFIIKKRSIFAVFIVLGIFGVDLVTVLNQTSWPSPAFGGPSLTDIAGALFGPYGFLLEVASFVLLAGLVTAIFLGKSFLAEKPSIEVVHHDPT